MMHSIREHIFVDFLNRMQIHIIGKNARFVHAVRFGRPNNVRHIAESDSVIYISITRWQF